MSLPNMSTSTINYMHYEELPSVMSRTHLGSKHRCTGTVTSRTGLSTDAAAHANTSASVAIGTSVNPDVGGRRLLNLSPLTTSKLNSAVEDTQKLEGMQTRLPTPDTGEDLVGDCAGPRDVHSGLKIQDFDAVERNRKAQKDQVLGNCRTLDTHARTKVCALDIADLACGSGREQRKGTNYG